MGSEPLQPKQPPQWKGDLSVREQIQIMHAEAYALNWFDAGIPGHNHIMLIAKLAKKLDDLEYARQKTLNMPSLLTPAAQAEIDPARPPDTSKRPRGMA